MNDKYIEENNFEGGVAGFGGTVNTQPGYGTPNFSSQDQSKFVNSNNNKALGSTSNTTKGREADKDIKQQVDKIYSKRPTPSPDTIISAIKREMSKQIKKDQHLAKQLVLSNLKKDPTYYDKPENMTDQDMVKNMTEQKQHPNDAPQRSKIKLNSAETKKIFTEMSVQHDNKYVVNSGISNVMKELWAAKHKRSDWKNGQ